MRIIDAHNHPDWLGYGLTRILENMEASQIDAMWLYTWECPEDEFHPRYTRTTPKATNGYPIPLDRCLHYKEQAPDKFVVGYAPDPRRPDALDRLEAAIDLYDVKVYGELKLRMMYDNPDALRIYRFCGERGLPVTVHIDYPLETDHPYPRPHWWYGGGLDAFERAVRTCPDTNFIGHAPGFWSHISGDDQYDKVSYPSGPVVPGGRVPQMLREYPNLFADLSAGSALNALQRDVEHAGHFLEEFQDRLLFGRDNFDNRLQTFLDELDLPEAVQGKIYARNALSLVADTAT